MFLRVPHEVVTDPRLTATDLRVLLAAATFADVATGANCRPAAKTIAAAANLSERAVRKSLDHCESLSLVRLTGRVSDIGATLPPFHTFPWFSGAANPAPYTAPFAAQPANPAPSSLHGLQGEPAQFAANLKPVTQNQETQIPAAVAGVPSLQPALAESTENSSTPATQSNPPAEQLALTLPEVKAPKVKKPPNPRAMLARAVWLEWNSRAETTLGWAPSSTFDGAILTVLGKASEYYGHENLLVLLDYAQTDLWYSADPSKRAGPWGILHFFASQNLDKLYAACRRAEHGAAA